MVQSYWLYCPVLSLSIQLDWWLLLLIVERAQKSGLLLARLLHSSLLVILARHMCSIRAPLFTHSQTVVVLFLPEGLGPNEAICWLLQVCVAQNGTVLGCGGINLVSVPSRASVGGIDRVSGISTLVSGATVSSGLASPTRSYAGAIAAKKHQ